MSKTTTSPRRPNAEYRWTKAKTFAFLDALVEHGTVGAASRAVGMSRNSAYRLRARLDPGFAQAWDEALKIAAKVRARREAAEFEQLAARYLAR